MTWRATRSLPAFPCCGGCAPARWMEAGSKARSVPTHFTSHRGGSWRPIPTARWEQFMCVFSIAAGWVSVTGARHARRLAAAFVTWGRRVGDWGTNLSLTLVHVHRLALCRPGRGSADPRRWGHLAPLGLASVLGSPRIVVGGTALGPPTAAAAAANATAATGTAKAKSADGFFLGPARARRLLRTGHVGPREKVAGYRMDMEASRAA